MDKIQFQSNDIVRLSKKKFEILSKELFFPQNLFVVKEINIVEDSILLNNINQKLSYEDIRPVRIDGEEDRDIYYEPIVAANLINAGEAIPVAHRDTYEYYMDALKNHIMNIMNHIMMRFVTLEQDMFMKYKTNFLYCDMI